MDVFLIFSDRRFRGQKHVTLIKNSGVRGELRLTVMHDVLRFRSKRLRGRGPSFVHLHAVVLRVSGVCLRTDLVVRVEDVVRRARRAAVAAIRFLRGAARCSTPSTRSGRALS